ncbi:uncharacterized protein LOC114283860 isoform X2 [Camellia sinensis]|uniref:uncharacterized protein LOC114283860 isoform X2 n=1 Tax=Camellia sinensis TaxID=4442 RepID=UPI00103677D5|nr:uncharacterized protein LOC114283860 isoform X2 [Camellia sinensis]
MLGITTNTALSPMGVVGMGMGFAAATATATATAKLQSRFRVSGEEAFPSFLPREVHKIKDPFARNLATRIHRLPLQKEANLHHQDHMEEEDLEEDETFQRERNEVHYFLFFSSCLEWRYTLPLLEEAGLETWALDILGWGFSHLERLPSCDVASKRDHLYQFWKSYIKRPMLLVGPSLGAAVAIDFAVNHSEAVEKLVLIDASVYSEGTSNMRKLPKAIAYAGVYLLKSIPLRLYATFLAFNGLPFGTCLDWTNVGRLHCLLPWWEDATVAFMNSGGYNVSSQIEQVKQKTLIIWGEDDQIISNKLAVKLHCELPNAIIRQVPDCGHIPHVEKPSVVSKLIAEFSCQDDC